MSTILHVTLQNSSCKNDCSNIRVRECCCRYACKEEKGGADVARGASKRAVTGNNHVESRLNAGSRTEVQDAFGSGFPIEITLYPLVFLIPR